MIALASFDVSVQQAADVEFAPRQLADEQVDCILASDALCNGNNPNLLNELGKINPGHGRAAGDEALCITANRLKQLGRCNNSGRRHQTRRRGPGGAQHHAHRRRTDPVEGARDQIGSHDRNCRISDGRHPYRGYYRARLWRHKRPQARSQPAQ